MGPCFPHSERGSMHAHCDPAALWLTLQWLANVIEVGPPGYRDCTVSCLCLSFSLKGPTRRRPGVRLQPPWLLPCNSLLDCIIAPGQGLGKSCCQHTRFFVFFSGGCTDFIEPISLFLSIYWRSIMPGRWQKSSPTPLVRLPTHPICLSYNTSIAFILWGHSKLDFIHRVKRRVKIV